MGDIQTPTGIRRTLVRLAACLSFALLPLTACQTSPAPSDPPVFEIETEGGGNTVEVLEAGGAAVFIVRSESGIGRATVRLASGQAPDSVLLRLHLTGLEEFKLSYDGTVIRAAGGIGRRVTEHLLANGGEQEINFLSPYWMAVDPSAGEGFFEIALPRDYFRNGSGDFSFEWVDFFR